MYRRKLTLFLSLIICGTSLANSLTLSLDSCRYLAVENNKELSILELQKQTAFYNRKSAFTNYLPKMSASGLYMHTGKELSLLSDEQKTAISGIGDALGMASLNAIGSGLVDALSTDTRNAIGAAVILTQPIYMGGKIRAYNNITKYSERIAADKYHQKHQELIVTIDETYWNIVALSARRELAKSYLNLVETLDDDIEQLITEGFATKADGLSVKVKINEAKVAIIQINHGIELLKMALCRQCGLPLDTNIILADENCEELPLDIQSAEITNDWQHRPELSSLSSAVGIYNEKVRLVQSEFLPSVVLTGGYASTYPSVYNSFEKKFKGTWNIGVVVNIPIITWGDRVYKVKAARADAVAAKLQLDESYEKIELQVKKCQQKVIEAKEKYSVALSGQTEAEENLRYATIGLKEGVTPITNILEAQTAWLSAKTALISSNIELRLANTYFRKSLGTIE